MNLGVLTGNIRGTEKIIYDSGIMAAGVTSVSTGAILNGDVDSTYIVIARYICATASTLNMYFNLDTTAANYGYLGITATSNTTASINSTASLIPLCNVDTTNTLGMSIFRIHTNSSKNVQAVGDNLNQISGTKVTQTAKIGAIYGPTGTTISSIQLKPSTGPFGAGTRIIILKGNNFQDGTECGAISTPQITGSFVVVSSATLAVSSNSITFQNLNSERDVFYIIRGTFKAAVGNTGQVLVRPNNSTDTSKYGYQLSYAANTSIGAFRTDTGLDYFYSGLTTLNQYSCFEHSFWVQGQGYARPCISFIQYDTTGTTVGGVYRPGHIFNDTSVSITSIVIATSTNYFAAGSEFVLLALRPNG